MSGNRRQDSLQAQIAMWEDELASWQVEKYTLDRRIATRERLLRTLREEGELGDPGLFPKSPSDVPAAAPGSRRPGTSQAIIAVLQDAGRPMTAGEVFVDLDERGWLPLDAKIPRNAVRASLWTLAKNGKISRLGETPASRRWAAKTSTPTASQASGTEDLG